MPFRLKLIMKSSNVVPALLLSPVFSDNVVPPLLPWRQQVVDVVAEIGDSAATLGHRCRCTTHPRQTASSSAQIAMDVSAATAGVRELDDAIGDNVSY
jgi:hypothetical protein